MTNDEFQNDERNPNDEFRNAPRIAARSFVIRASSFFRYSLLVIRPFSMNSRLLIIEDELPMRTALKDCLEGEGYRVLTATDGQSGLERAIEEQPDLILLDIMMPRVDGFAVCAELRRLAN